MATSGETAGTVAADFMEQSEQKCEGGGPDGGDCPNFLTVGRLRALQFAREKLGDEGPMLCLSCQEAAEQYGQVGRRNELVVHSRGAFAVSGHAAHE